MSGEERHAEKTRRIADDGTEYDCQAYGPGSMAHCFLEQLDPCSSRAVCERAMVAERMILWVRLLALRELGDETAKWMLENLDGPGDLLNGDRVVEDQADEEDRTHD